MPRVAAVVFDLDGTLVDSLPDIAASLVAALADFGIAAPPMESIRSWIGGGARMLVARAVRPELVDAVFARVGEHYAASPVAHTRVYDGLGPVLDRCAAGCKLAVLSNKPHALTVRICEALLAPWPFATIVGHKPGAALKPDPRSALAIAGELGVDPTACALVGDAGSDIATARAAGMAAVAVSWGYRPRDELVAAVPQLLADRPEDLLALLA